MARKNKDDVFISFDINDEVYPCATIQKLSEYIFNKNDKIKKIVILPSEKINEIKRYSAKYKKWNLLFNTIELYGDDETNTITDDIEFDFLLLVRTQKAFIPLIKNITIYNEEQDGKYGAFFKYVVKYSEDTDTDINTTYDNKKHKDDINKEINKNILSQLDAII